jgi:hypothetical protein
MITYVLPIALTMHLDALYAMFYRLPDGVRGVLEVRYAILSDYEASLKHACRL